MTEGDLMNPDDILDIILKPGSVIAETLLNEGAAEALKEKAS